MDGTLDDISTSGSDGLVLMCLDHISTGCCQHLVLMWVIQGLRRGPPFPTSTTGCKNIRY
jgi:hypothetical protein